MSKDRHSWRDLALLTVIYTLAWGLMLVNRGFYIDDWAYGRDVSFIMAACKQGGRPLLAYVYPLIFKFPSPVSAARVVIFLAYLSSAISVYLTLATLTVIARRERLLISIFFAIFPVYFSRLLLTNAHFAVSCACFFAAWWCVGRYFQTRTLIFRLVALALFFIAFFIESFLVLYGVLLVAYLGYVEITVHGKLSCNGMIRRVGLSLDFFGLPVIFWIARTLWFTPYGSFAAYNQIQAQNLYVTMVQRFHQLWYHSFLHPMGYAVATIFGETSWAIWGGILVIAIGIWWGLKTIWRRPNTDAPRSYEGWFLGLGVLLFLSAILPYCAVLKIPGVFDWADRFQLLVPLGAALLLTYGLRILLHPKAYVHVAAILIACFVGADALTMLDFQRDWFKQQALMEQFQASKIMRNATTFIITDQTKDWDVLKRGYLPYEYTGMMVTLFGEETRFATSIEKFCKRNQGNPNALLEEAKNRALPPWSHFHDYQAALPQYHIIIHPGALALTRSQTLQLLVRQVMSPDVFRQQLRDILQVTYIRWQDVSVQGACAKLF